MTRTPEQMLADRLRRVNRPEDREYREDLAHRLERFGGRLDSDSGEWTPELRQEWFHLARAARIAVQGRRFADTSGPDPGCGWNQADAAPFCDWDPGCLVHGGKGE